MLTLQDISQFPESVPNSPGLFSSGDCGGCGDSGGGRGERERVRVRVREREIKKKEKRKRRERERKIGIGKERKRKRSHQYPSRVIQLRGSRRPRPLV